MPDRLPPVLGFAKEAWIIMQQADMPDLVSDCLDADPLGHEYVTQFDLAIATADPGCLPVTSVTLFQRMGFGPRRHPVPCFVEEAWITIHQVIPRSACRRLSRVPAYLPARTVFRWILALRKLDSPVPDQPQGRRVDRLSPGLGDTVLARRECVCFDRVFHARSRV